MIIDKDFLSEQEIKQIQNTVFKELPFFYVNNHSDDSGPKDNDSEYFFTHILYKDDVPRSDFFNYFLSIFTKFLNKNDLEFKSLLRARINLYPKHDKQVATPHTDWNFKHNAFIYYINDSDGDTIIYNKKNEDIFDITGTLPILTTISPESGKAIVFDGDYYHSASNPKNYNKRIVLNISYL